MTSPHEELLAELSAETTPRRSARRRCSPGRSRDGSSSCSSGARSRGASLEIGTFSGHSALAMAAGAARRRPPRRAASSIPSARRSRRATSTARRTGRRSRCTSARRSTRSRGSKATFDFVFIDADKDGLRRLLRGGRCRGSRERGLIVADNTLWSGRVLDGEGPIVAFNDHVAADPRTVQVLLSVRDGMTLIRHA